MTMHLISTFSAALPDSEDFDAETDSRRFKALIVPWGTPTRDYRKLSFAKDSITVDGPATRLKVHTDHELSVDNLVGQVVKLESTDAGLEATFEIAAGSHFDRLVELVRSGVLDGVSVGMAAKDPNKGLKREFDEETGTTTILEGATIYELSLVTTPAFNGARVQLSADFENLFTIPEAEENNMPEFDTEAFGTAVGEALAPALKSVADAVESLSISRPSGDEPVAVVPTSSARAVDRAPYGTGSQHSLVRDAWAASGKAFSTPADTDIARYRRFSAALEAGDYQLAVTETSKGKSFAFEGAQTFAPEATTDHPALTPQRRLGVLDTYLLTPTPLAGLVTGGTISDARSFAWPMFVSHSGLWAEVAEGVNPTPGTIETDEQDVTPFELAGSIQLTRRVLDTADHNIDSLALTAMADARGIYLEAKLAALLNAVVAANTGPGAVIEIDLTDPLDVSDKITDEFVNAALRAGGFRYTGGAVTPALLKVLRKARDLDNRRLFPYVSDGTADGTVSTRNASVTIDGLTLHAAGSLVASENSYLITKPDVNYWLSPVKGFRFEEKIGPASIELAAHGYGAVAVTRTTGIARLNDPA